MTKRDKDIADRLFYEQCQRLGPIEGVPLPVNPRHARSADPKEQPVMVMTGDQKELPANEYYSWNERKWIDAATDWD